MWHITRLTVRGRYLFTELYLTVFAEDEGMDLVCSVMWDFNMGRNVASCRISWPGVRGLSWSVFLIHVFPIVTWSALAFGIFSFSRFSHKCLRQFKSYVCFITDLSLFSVFVLDHSPLRRMEIQYICGTPYKDFKFLFRLRVFNCSNV